MKEEDIRPKAIFDAYLRLAEKDAETYFGSVERQDIPCPACGTPGEKQFEKLGFSYDRCPKCLTLYVNPRPPASAFERYYRESPSTEYWATTFYKETAEARRNMIWKPKARQIADIISRHHDRADDVTVVDIGGGFGIFAEEYRNLTKRDAVVIEPGASLAQACRDKGLRVIEAFVEHVQPEDLPDGSRIFVSFELFEHLPDPADFVGCVGSLMRPGDLFVFTTLSGVGADILALWQDSKSVSPPHHLNFFNPKSATHLLVANGFEVLETATPGKLDIDLMLNNRAHLKDRFWQTMMDYLDEAERTRFQSVLAELKLSSHMLIVCRKGAAA